MLPAVACVAPRDVAAIDALLGGAGSPLAGEGRVFVRRAAAAGIDPRFLLAITAQESGFGLYPPSQAIHNPFGLGPGIRFPSDAAAITRVARTLSRYYVEEGRTRIATIGPKWAPIGAANDPRGLNENWVGGVSAYFRALGGDPKRPILLESQPSDCPVATSPAAPGAIPPAPAPAPPSPEPTDRASGLSLVTTWIGAAVMLLLVIYLAHKRYHDPAPRPASQRPAPRWTPLPGVPVAVGGSVRRLPAATRVPHADGSWALAWSRDTALLLASTWAEGGNGSTPREPAIAPGRQAETVKVDPVVQPELAVDPVVQLELVVEPVVEVVVEAEPVAEMVVEPGPEFVQAVEVEREPQFEVAMPEPPLRDQSAAVADIVPTLLEGLVPLDRVCDHPGVTPRMHTLIRILADTPLSVNEQARRLGITRAEAALLSSRLEGMGLAQREPVGTDRRRIRLALTEAGYTLYADTSAAPEPAEIARILSRMTPAERAGLLAGLRALSSAA